MRNKMANKQTLLEKKFIWSDIKNTVLNPQKMHCIYITNVSKTHIVFNVKTGDTYTYHLSVKG
jgi:glycerol kinase